VLHIAGGGQHDVLGGVRRAVVALDRPTANRPDHVRAPDHGAAERVRAEHRFGGEVVNELLGVVVEHGDLLEHDVALGVEIRERRREDHVGHHVERPLQVLVGDARVEQRRLARGRGVQLAAQLVEDLGDLLRGVPRRAAEEQVLDEVRDAGLAGRLVT
jgi:hypothetical protein